MRCIFIPRSPSVMQAAYVSADRRRSFSFVRSAMIVPPIIAERQAHT
jgi:hypothetical protein